MAIYDYGELYMRWFDFTREYEAGMAQAKTFHDAYIAELAKRRLVQ